MSTPTFFLKEKKQDWIIFQKVIKVFYHHIVKGGIWKKPGCSPQAFLNNGSQFPRSWRKGSRAFLNWRCFQKTCAGHQHCLEKQQEEGKTRGQWEVCVLNQEGELQARETPRPSTQRHTPCCKTTVMRKDRHLIIPTAWLQPDLLVYPYGADRELTVIYEVRDVCLDWKEIHGSTHKVSLQCSPSTRGNRVALMAAPPRTLPQNKSPHLEPRKCQYRLWHCSSLERRTSSRGHKVCHWVIGRFQILHTRHTEDTWHPTWI